MFFLLYYFCVKRIWRSENLTFFSMQTRMNLGYKKDWTRTEDDDWHDWFWYFVGISGLLNSHYVSILNENMSCFIHFIVLLLDTQVKNVCDRFVYKILRSFQWAFVKGLIENVWRNLNSLHFSWNVYSYF